MTTQTIEDSGLYNKKQAAKYLRICVRTLEYLIESGKITYRRSGGPEDGKIVFKKEDLDARLEPVGGPGMKRKR